MKEKLSQRDWESISAYLDGQLSPRELARFNDRLASNAHLNRALTEMLQTRTLLRQAPHLRAPRDYRLTPQMAGQQKRYLRFTPALGWVSAVASFLLIFVLFGDSLSPAGPIPNPWADFAANTVMQEVFIAPSDGGMAEESPALEAVAEPAAKAAEPEISAGEAAPEVAAAPAEEAASETRDAEIAAAPLPEEEPEVAIIIPGQSMDESAGEGADEPVTQPAAEEAGAAVLAETFGITETIAAAESEAQPRFEAEAAEEATAPAATEVAAAALAEGDEAPVEAAPSPISEDQPETAATQPLEAAQALPDAQDQPSPAAAMEETSAPEAEPASAQALRRQSMLFLGVEVVLGLLAIGAGGVWWYLRRQR